MVEIFVAYIKGYSAYRVVSPYKTYTKVMANNCDDAVLAALKSTKSRNVTLVTKSNIYEWLYKGVTPRDEVQRAIYGILLDKKVTFQRIDEHSQKQLVDIMKAETTIAKVKSENNNEEVVIPTPNAKVETKFDDVVFDLDTDDKGDDLMDKCTNVSEEDKKESESLLEGDDPFS